MENNTNHIAISMKLTLEEMYSGLSKQIKYKRRMPCTSCNQAKDCTTCLGKGWMFQETTEEIKIPAGVDSGMVLNFRGKGHYFHKKKKVWEVFSKNKGDFGSLIITIEAVKHKLFYRKNMDLVHECRMERALLAVTDQRIEVQHLNQETIKILIPQNTDNGKVYRIKGLGFKNIANNETGSLLIVVKLI